MNLRMVAVIALAVVAAILVISFLTGPVAFVQRQFASGCTFNTPFGSFPGSNPNCGTSLPKVAWIALFVGIFGLAPLVLALFYVPARPQLLVASVLLLGLSWALAQGWLFFVPGVYS